MKKDKFDLWCSIASGRILFPPDRDEVYEELMQHLQDRQEDLMAQGMDEETATEQTLLSMGDAKEIAPQLAALHKPFWGYALLVSKLLLVFVLIFSLIPIWNYITKVCNFYDPEHYYRDYAFDVFDPASYDNHSERTLHHLSEPNVSFSSDGYRFTVTDAALFTHQPEQQDGQITQLFFLLEQRGSLSWTKTEGYYNTLGSSSVSNQLFARDSLGNYYYSNASRYHDDPALLVVDCQTGLFTATHVCWINNFPKDAEWVEICYARDGRSFSLLIDLTGGDGK